MGNNLQITGTVQHNKGSFIKNHEGNKYPGVTCGRIQYYDLKNVKMLSNSDTAKLIHIVKSFMQSGKEVIFINANNKIKNKIRQMELSQILKCT
jgi:ABC-type transporter Mla MlaB component